MSLVDCVTSLPYHCQVVGFYSYKGGVGRTMALCNVAAQLARQHAKRKAQSRSKALGSKPKSLRILCVDLDLEAPGIPAYLPPAKDTKVKGFLGLLGEYFGRDGRPLWDGETVEREIRRALGEQLTDYAYAVPGTDHLFVLPTGSLAADETIRVRRALYDLLEPLRRADSQGTARKEVPFFPKFSSVLQELFDYALVDSRTGLADTSYATTTVLADGMVLFFRPNLTQLMGIQDVFGRFLVERPELTLESGPKRIPVIPVLSPRPNYSTPRLQEVRKAAVERIFRWLDPNTPGSSGAAADPYAPAPSKLHELPFDSSLEIGERLIIPPTPDVKIEDEEAPLYKGYVDLTKEIQKNNAEHDDLGKKILELEHYHAGRTDEALNCLLSAIADEPGNVSLWRNIWGGYSGPVSLSASAKRQVMSFCEEARRLSEDHQVPRFFGALWLSEVYEALAPGKCPELIAELWAAALRVMDATMLSDGLTRIIKYYNVHATQPKLVGCPSRKQAVAAWMLRELRIDLDIPDLLKVLVGAEDYFKEEPETGVQGLALFHDQLCLATNNSTRAAILEDVAKAYVLQGDLRSGYKAYAAATALPECSDDVRRSFLYLQMLVLPRKVVERSIRNILPKILQPAVLLILEIREGADIEAVRARLKDSKNVSPTLGEDPTFEYYALMHHRRFPKAFALMSEHLGKVKGGVGVRDLARLRLAHWLSSDTALDHEITAYARTIIADPEFVLDKLDFDICLALACCPTDLAQEAVRRLSRAQWPLVKFGWTLVSCITGHDYDQRRAEMEAMLNENPFFAFMIRKHEDFPLLSFILERHQSLGQVKADAVRRSMDTIEFVASVTANFGAQPKPLKVPKSIAKKDDQCFKEVLVRWKRDLAWIRDDEGMRTVVDKLLEAPIEPSAHEQ